MKLIAILIILLFPLAALAHEGEVHLSVDPTALPGERGYFWEKIGEWINVNLLTLSTRQKQEKKLKLAAERVAEILALLERKDVEKQHLETAWRRYETQLLEAEYMAEKIIFLDGKEIALAEKLEETTRIHEQILAQALELTSQENRPVVLQSLNFARVQNEAVFKFMVRNYQATDADIEKHKRILDEHFEILEKFRGADIENYLEKAERFRDAGLNIEAYDHLHLAKNLVYSRVK